MTSRLQGLITQYKQTANSTNWKRKAELEKEIRNAIFDEDPQPRGPFGIVLARFLGGSRQDYDHRSTLLNSGPWVNSFWNMLDKGVAQYTVIRLYRESKALAEKENMEFVDAAEYVIDDYEKSGYSASTPDGRKFRKAAPYSKSQRSSAPPVSTPLPAAMPVNGAGEEPSFLSMDSQQSRSKTLLVRLNVLVEDFVRASMVEYKDVDFHEQQKAVDDFRHFVHEACEDLRRNVNRLRATAVKSAKAKKVSRDEFRKACEVLGLGQGFTFGKEINLTAAKRAMLKRAAQLHPDHNGGETNKVQEYQTVIESLAVLETYVKGLNSHATGERTHEGH
jgi:hypothetical protein